MDHYFLTNGPLQWKGAVRIIIQTADKNIKLIHKKSM